MIPTENFRKQAENLQFFKGNQKKKKKKINQRIKSCLKDGNETHLYPPSNDP